MKRKITITKNSQNKKKLYQLTNHLYNELKDNQHIIFKRLRGCTGEYDLFNDEISIDYRKDILPTLIHELIHKWNPGRCESWVIKKEKYIMKRLSANQAKRILRLLSDII